MKTLTKKLKQKWIKALRSGKYKQGKERLYNEEEDSYCCLGVLELIAGIDTKSDAFLQTTGELITHKAISCVKGLDMKMQIKLADMNDSEDNDFNDIAKYIEVQY